jgi:hypothetical protein
MAESDDDYAFDTSAAAYSSRSKVRGRGGRGGSCGWREAACWLVGLGGACWWWLVDLMAVQRASPSPCAACSSLPMLADSQAAQADRLTAAPTPGPTPSNAPTHPPCATPGPVRHPEAGGDPPAAAPRRVGGHVGAGAQRRRGGARAAPVQVVSAKSGGGVVHSCMRVLLAEPWDGRSRPCCLAAACCVPVCYQTSTGLLFAAESRFLQLLITLALVPPPRSTQGCPPRQ